ncbi:MULTISPECIES: uracil-DNA glycosylase family protein [Legionella]|uniref:Uracil-DNA glycosylase n=1 Tax=Legionella septentrionalis TaxID=2498109 RepID=A0A433JL44_9GAMM|nr:MULTISPECIES: uracil-DNA glycosylase [Legionella]MCP0913439.1 uracil-DNA glycosylase [Legionella sp. 27cVA30]RUQ89783.1 uracil-DNA glycosylase [Legionella septentrionalis]RUQ99571.1 uracil-DNA glycosylase [Legionella septentrionalis]RUR09826.1 uracil-DNA glycosylase [Legionella septentrionalis]RUR13629.1 uracil-DNA glycosylase [Legionella septentrionalis]
MHPLLKQAHPQWHIILDKALGHVDPDYLKELETMGSCLPNKECIFRAFSIPLAATEYVLLGESPYPRPESANGFAFWDNAVGSLWSSTGLSKEVNRATSLRNWIKMLLYARGDLQQDFSQNAIAKLNKTSYVQTASELFNAFLNKGFLLLNATLVYSKGDVNYHARKWKPFIQQLFLQLAEIKPSLKLVLFGRIANEIPGSDLFSSLIAEHPYNLSFITNPNVVAFFKPLDLLSHEKKHN